MIHLGSLADRRLSRRKLLPSAISCIYNELPVAACVTVKCTPSVLDSLMHHLRFSYCLLLFALTATVFAADLDRPNVLIVTVDDMSADSLGAFGCELADTSPNIDAFAKESFRFQHAHCVVRNSLPGRNIMLSGLYSHVNGVEGFVQNKTPDYPVLCDLAQQAGYFAAIRGKASHSTPYHPYPWDANLDETKDGKKRHNKDAASYGDSTRDGIAMAKEAGKPFCLMVNISDPHKPFYAQGKGGDTVEDRHVPSRVFTAAEVPVPGFLPSDDVIKKELAHYYSSVRRADDCFREIMFALDESGQTENTFVLFLSDHGMPLPFAKTQLYHHSTRTPLVVRWPGVTQANSIDDKHMISAVDFLPTLLEVMKHKHPTPDRLHGKSFASLLRGEAQTDRDHVVLQYNENSGRNRHPMRGIQTRQYLYLYNPWSDGRRKFATATTGTQTYKQMVKRAENETDVAMRLALFDHRVVEELFDIQNDPDCLMNLMGDPSHRASLEILRTQLTTSLKTIKDPVAPLVEMVDDADLRNAFMAAEDKRSADAKKAKQNKNKKPSQQKGDPAKRRARRLQNAIKVVAPTSVTLGGKCTVVIEHKLPKALSSQKLYVTLKTASMDPAAATNDRIHRQMIEIQGAGEAKVEFDVPANVDLDAIRFAAFVGDDFQSSLEHVLSDPIPVK